MNTWNLIILVAACVLFTVTMAAIIVLLVKKGWINDIKEVLETSIKEAEIAFPEPNSGEKKKEYVMNAIQTWCNNKSVWASFLFKGFKKVASGLINTIISNYNLIAK